MVELNALSLGLVPVVLGVVQIIKGLGINPKWSPVVAIVLGILLGFLVTTGWQSIILSGIVIGLSASGLWSSAKSLSGR